MTANDTNPRDFNNKYAYKENLREMPSFDVMPSQPNNDEHLPMVAGDDYKAY